MLCVPNSAGSVFFAVFLQTLKLFEGALHGVTFDSCADEANDIIMKWIEARLDGSVFVTSALDVVPRSVKTLSVGGEIGNGHAVLDDDDEDGITIFVQSDDDEERPQPNIEDALLSST